MALSGYVKLPFRRNGGIRTLLLAGVDEIASVTFDAATKSCTQITMVEQSFFQKYEFNEDDAIYHESVSVSDGVTVVEHELKFVLDKMCGQSAQAIEELIGTSNKGIVALVVTSNDEKFLVGYSKEFRGERALRLHSALGSTGKQLKDSSTEVITLRSVDVAKAKSYTGSMDALVEA